MPSARQVVLVLLAAGRAHRMGRQKLVLQIEGRTLLERALDACRHHPTVVVVGPETEAELRRLGSLSHVIAVVRQPEPERGLASSARLGAQAICSEAAIGIVLADRPFLTSQVVDRIVERYRAGDAEIVYPVVNGAPAHPVIFSPSMRAQLVNAPDGESLQALRDAPNAATELVDLDDPGVLFDVDTKEDLERARAWAQRTSLPW